MTTPTGCAAAQAERTAVPAARRAAPVACRPVPRVPDPEQGAATVLVAGIVAAALILLVGVLALARVQVARHEAQGAADLGSLAAAAALQRGATPAEACGAADRLVRANGARRSSCVVEQEEVVVRAEVAVELGVLGRHDSFATARAGPQR